MGLSSARKRFTVMLLTNYGRKMKSDLGDTVVSAFGKVGKL